MLESFPFILILGTLLGFLSGIGVGGGSLLMLWLTVVMAVPHSQARMINLLFFIPGALIACLFRWQQRVLNPKDLLGAIVAGCIAAALFSWLGTRMDANLLKKGFGILLIVTGIRELLYKTKNHPRTS